MTLCKFYNFDRHFIIGNINKNIYNRINSLFLESLIHNQPNKLSNCYKYIIEVDILNKNNNKEYLWQDLQEYYINLKKEEFLKWQINYIYTHILYDKLDQLEVPDKELIFLVTSDNTIILLHQNNVIKYQIDDISSYLAVADITTIDLDQLMPYI